MTGPNTRSQTAHRLRPASAGAPQLSHRFSKVDPWPVGGHPAPVIAPDPSASSGSERSNGTRSVSTRGRPHATQKRYPWIRLDSHSWQSIRQPRVRLPEGADPKTTQDCGQHGPCASRAGLPGGSGAKGRGSGPKVPRSRAIVCARGPCTALNGRTRHACGLTIPVTPAANWQAGRPDGLIVWRPAAHGASSPIVFVDDVPCAPGVRPSASLVRPATACVLSTAFGLPTDDLAALLVSSHGAVIVGTTTGALVSVEGGRIVPVWRAAASIAIRSAIEDRQGNLWAGTSLGIYRLARNGLVTWRHPMRQPAIVNALTFAEGAGDGVYALASGDGSTASASRAWRPCAREPSRGR